MRNLSFPHEPAIYVGAVNAVILLGVSFGLPVSMEQKVAIDGFVGTITVLLGAILVRQNVTPVVAVEEHMEAVHNVEAKTLS